MTHIAPYHSIALTRRRLLAASALGACALTACGRVGTTSSTAADDSPSAPAAGTAGSAAVPTLDELIPLTASFSQSSYEDERTGLSLPFNVFLPEGYDGTGSYPLITFIADSSRVGDDVAAPLSQYGALIWAHETTQARAASIVVVPCYPEVVLDDHGGYTTTDWIGVTQRFVPWLQERYAVDSSRVYGTGQSMGAMIHLLLQATDPALFTACLFVDGQWDISQLAGLKEATWAYHVAGGDERALAGQQEVRAMLDADAIPYAQAGETWDATATPAELDAAVSELVSSGRPRLFSSFTAGTVMEANPGTGMEHMASFEPAYRLTGLRQWLLAQTS
ncbi:alpha/beta hydrolase-fold protein [Actinomyces gaoshouyii]|uniref:Acyl-CoA:diacylglycerol acyltransferase n=1 Tax=Actinomyces gaoshouyii TaxID=1960083 RepID=A0A8H9HB50_9ACTO|nr:alpha/beta hydrolase-fold protein [Actinomyces gaoshouyii]GGO99521.1 hypothetical protein GCM10011612_16980 [Actinomyces gaoshouyii]